MFIESHIGNNHFYVDTTTSEKSEKCVCVRACTNICVPNGKKAPFIAGYLRVHGYEIIVGGRS